MRWTEIEEFADQLSLALPTYRQMDIWTRQGLITAEFKGDRHGQYRDWNNVERDVALLVARLVPVGLSVDLAFQLARTQPGEDGERTLYLDGAERPFVTVTVAKHE